ncbi:hypothetical protein [Curtobacterium sp. NPDC090223]|uniref:hypothetical protein n=1 Tax=Curtobacterium sp. NPDC090223 TaxID=3363972 RepID=UPI00380CC53F
MNEATLRPYLDAHLDALTRGDVDAISEDFIAELRPHVPAVVASLPTPILSAESISVEIDPEKAVVFNRLTAPNNTVITMRSEWIVSDGRPRILNGAPVEN